MKTTQTARLWRAVLTGLVGIPIGVVSFRFHINSTNFGMISIIAAFMLTLFLAMYFDTEIFRAAGLREYPELKLPSAKEITKGRKAISTMELTAVVFKAIAESEKGPTDTPTAMGAVAMVMAVVLHAAFTGAYHSTWAPSMIIYAFLLSTALTSLYGIFMLFLNIYKAERNGYPVPKWYKRLVVLTYILVMVAL